MTKYYYESVEDQRLIEQSFYNIAWLIFGKNNGDKINSFKKTFESDVKQVNVFSQNTTTKYLNNRTPGVCRVDEEEKIIIEMLGYKNSNPSQHLFIKHEGRHEFCHAFADLLPKMYSRQPNGIIKNGIKCENNMGLIKETDPISGKLIGQHYYGKLFNETAMDIITSMSINAFDSNNHNKTADDILKSSYDQWDNAKTGYSIFTSLTRLTIAAFSNNGFLNYQQIIDAGHSIINLNTRMYNNEVYKANDFLYGILFDPLHIEEEFDKFMGEGYYRVFCEYLDRLFIKYQTNQTIPSKEVKIVMNILPNFLNRKINYYKEHGIINLEDADKIVGNFNQIWNSMQVEYSSFFTEADIDEIAKNAGRK